MNRFKRRPRRLHTLLLCISGLSLWLLLDMTPAHAESGDVTTLAGNQQGYLDDVGLNAQFNTPYGLATDALGNVFVADFFNDRIRKVTPSGTVTTFAGNGQRGLANGDRSSASFNRPTGLAVDASGTVFVADYGNHAIRKITASGVVSTLAGGNGAGSTNGPGLSASFSSPSGVAIDQASNVIVADYGNNSIRKISSTGVVTTVAGSGTPGSVDASGTTATFFGPTGVAVGNSGNIFVADAGNDKIRKIDADGTVTTFAGSGNRASLDGIGIEASFFGANSITSDSAGSLYVGERFRHRVRKISAGGLVSTLAGSDTSGSFDGNGGAAQFNNPSGVATDVFGNLFVADSGNFSIRKIELVTPVVGTVPVVHPLAALVALAAVGGGLLLRRKRMIRVGRVVRY